MKYFFLFVTLVFGANSKQLPSVFKPCSVSDNKCLQNAMQSGITALKDGLPELGIDKLDPMTVEPMEVPRGSGPLMVDIKFYDSELSGLTNGKVRDARMDWDKSTLFFNHEEDELISKSKYAVNGQILLLPIHGRGDVTMKYEKVVGSHEIKFKKYEKDGETYFKIANYKLVLNVQKMTFQFDNLFNGDKVLGNAMNGVINSNWEMFWQQMRSNVDEHYMKMYRKIANKVFSQIPVKEIFLGVE